MDVNQKNSQPVKSDDFFNLKDLFFIVVQKWRWVLISVIICLGLATLYILRTSPVYTRSASVLIKDTYNGTTVSSDLGSFSELGLFQSNVDVNNELIAFQSPVLMTEVVKRLNLNMSYSVSGLFRKHVLYGKNLPVKVVLPDVEEDDVVRFTLLLNPDNSVLISNLIYYEDNEKIESEKEYECGVNDTLQTGTKVGKIVLIQNTKHDRVDPLEIEVAHMSMYGAVNSFKQKLTASLAAEKAAVIDLTVEDLSIQRADDMLNTLIDVYNRRWIDDKNQMSNSTSEFINDRLVLIEAELGIVDEDISSYRSKNLLPDLELASRIYLTQSEEDSRRILELSNQMYMVKYLKKYMTDSKYTNTLLPANLGLGNVSLESQVKEYNRLLLQRNTLIANSSANNPLVKDLEEKIGSMHDAVLVSIDNQMATLETQNRSLQKTEKKTNSRIAAGPEQAKYLVNIERQQKVKEALYLFLLQKREENELSQAFTAYNTRIIATPNGRRSPTSPIRNRVFMIAVVIGVLLPVVIIFIIENMNTKIRGKKDIEGLSIPFVGEIPLKTGKKQNFSIFKKAPAEDHKIVVAEGARDVINEAFRVVRTNFEFVAGKNSKDNVSIVTSFNPGSGKSFITMNLALSLAIKGKKVLVIDGDLRHASASSYIHSPGIGLSDYLVNRIDSFEKAIVPYEKDMNLFVLPVGTIPPNPTELLVDERFDMMVKTLKEQYDYVFIDCPPVDLVADTQIIERSADRTIFIVRAGLLEKTMLNDLKNMYQEKRFGNMSIILNGTELVDARYGYKYGYGSKSGYYSYSNK